MNPDPEIREILTLYLLGGVMSSHTQLRKEKWSKLHEILELDESAGAKENKLKSLIDSLMTTSLIDELNKFKSFYAVSDGLVHVSQVVQAVDQRIKELKNE